MKYEQLTGLLIDEIPEISEDYKKELAWWHSGESEEPGQHIVFGDVLVPFVFRCLDEGREEVLRRIFLFLEQLAESSDERVQEVVAVTVCPGLGSRKKYRKAILKFLKPRTRHLCDQMRAL